jgi:hypothetical protein
MRQLLHLIFSTLILAALGTPAQGQITIQSSDLASVGDSIIRTQDTTTAVLDAGAGGMTSWDFSGLDSTLKDTFRVKDPAQGQFASDFPTASYFLQIDSFETYQRKTADSLLDLGAGGTISFNNQTLTAAFVYNAPLQSLRFPAQYQNTFRDSAHATVKIADVEIDNPVSPVPATITIDSVRWERSITRFDTLDGYGALTLPNDTTFDQTLRQKRKERSLDTIYVKDGTLTGGTWQYDIAGVGELTMQDTLFTYNWFAKDFGFPVLTFQAGREDSIQNGVTYTRRYSKSSDTDTTARPLSVNTIEGLEVRLGPNPVRQGRLLLQTRAEHARRFRAELLDVQGRAVWQARLQVRRGTQQQALQLRNVAEGRYWLRLRSPAGSVVRSVLVQR